MARKRKKGPSAASRLTRKVATRKRANPAPPRRVPRDNPSMLKGATDLVIPGVLSYAATRIVGRIAYKIGKRRSVRAAKHAGALAPPIAAAATFVAAHKMERLAPYRSGLVVGSTIAGIQALVQAYIPQYGWVLNDYHLDDVLPLQQKQTQNQKAALPPPPASTDAPYDEIDAMIAEANATSSSSPRATGQPPQPSGIEDLLESQTWSSSLH